MWPTYFLAWQCSVWVGASIEQKEAQLNKKTGEKRDVKYQWVEKGPNKPSKINVLRLEKYLTSAKLIRYCKKLISD
jgi:hypothetical protein